MAQISLSIFKDQPTPPRGYSLEYIRPTSKPHRWSRRSALVSWQARQGWRSARIGSGRPVEGRTILAHWVIHTVGLSLLRAALHAESCVYLRHNVLRAARAPRLIT